MFYWNSVVLICDTTFNGIFGENKTACISVAVLYTHRMLAGFTILFAVGVVGALVLFAIYVGLNKKIIFNLKHQHQIEKESYVKKQSVFLQVLLNWYNHQLKLYKRGEFLALGINRILLPIVGIAHSLILLILPACLTFAVNNDKAGGFERFLIFSVFLTVAIGTVSLLTFVGKVPAHCTDIIHEFRKKFSRDVEKLKGKNLKYLRLKLRCNQRLMKFHISNNYVYDMDKPLEFINHVIDKAILYSAILNF